jgi:molybdate transport system substrate-binding protein
MSKPLNLRSLKYTEVSTTGTSNPMMNLKRLSRAVGLALALLAAPLRAQDLIVSAAASLSDAFPPIGQAFESTHPGTHVIFNFAASGTLLQQIVQGAPADVFASADETTMEQAQTQSLINPATRADFAANTLVLILPATSKLLPKSLDELLGPAWNRIAIGNTASVPAGRYAKQALDMAGIGVRLENKLVPGESVRQVLTYVARGEVDAGFVYATDAATARDKVRVALTLPTQTPIRYPIAQVAASRHPELAGAFIAEVRSATGRASLLRYGFAVP